MSLHPHLVLFPYSCCSVKGHVEESDPYRTKTRDGKTILCYACGLAASAVKKLRIIGCDACSHHFHLDCLDPPLVTPPPVTTKWVCPLHMDQIAPSHQVTQETKVIPIDKPNTPNNGDIDVILAPEERTKAKQIEVIKINGVKYHVPENIIILDFWAKLGKRKDISNAERPEPNSVDDDLHSTAPILEKSVTAPTPPKNPLFTPPPKFNSIGVQCDLSYSSSRLSPDPSSFPSRAPFTPSVKSAAKQSKLTCLLQAAQQVDEASKSVTDAGLILLGNTASLQSQVPSNVPVKAKKNKSLLQPVSSASHISTRDCNQVQPLHSSCNPLQPRGSNRSAKSTSMGSKLSNLKDSTKSKSSQDQAGSSLSQPFTIPQFHSTHVDMVPSNNQVSSLDKLFSCQNQIIASPIHAGCQWTGPRHISLGPARSTIFMGQGGPGLYLKSLGPTHDPACGGPGPTHGL